MVKKYQGLPANLKEQKKKYQDIVFVLVFEQLEGEEQDASGVRLQEVVGRKSLDHLQDQLPDLLDVVLRDEVRRRVLREQTQCG